MIQNKTIQIDDIQTKLSSTGNTKYIIISGKDKYYFWGTHKGGDSPVYQSFKGMQSAGRIKKGAVVAIGFVEEEKSFQNPKGETVNYKDRSIIGLREADGLDTAQNPPQGKSPRSEAPISSQSQPDDYWDKKAYKQCLWNYWLEKYEHAIPMNGIDEPLAPKDADLVWQVFKHIEADADKRFAKGWAKAEAIYGELPTINQDDDPAGDYNPFVNDVPPLEAYDEDLASETTM